jgi:chemotaxis protein methyltransferase CheR
MPGGAALSVEDLALLNGILESHFGLVFPVTKKEILAARLRPRLDVLRLGSFGDYVRTLLADRDGEIDELAKAVTNNETYFFRERYQFDTLFGRSIPLLRPDLALAGKLRILCAGSSSGEEAYTLSFYAKDADHARALAGLTVQIDAFDIDADRVGMAQRATYRPRSIHEMRPHEVERYLRNTDPGRYVVEQRYLDGVGFFRGNVMDQDSFQQPVRYDVIFCRNVLIYFSETSFQQAIENLGAVLRPGGLLFLGHSESLIGRSELFETVRLDGCIAYRRVGA